MKEFIFSIYNIIIFSFYYALNVDITDNKTHVGGKIVITYFYILYLCYMMFIYLNLYKNLSDDDADDRYSFYAWILCYFIVLNIFIWREYNFLSIESYFMLTGIIIVLVFFTTIMLSFYTIRYPCLILLLYRRISLGNG